MSAIEPAITVEGVSKRYQLGQIGATTLREETERMLRRLRRTLRGRPGLAPNVAPADAREFWALKDVSLTVSPGEVVGIVGHNGAGKTTLLKILSRITKPTSGKIMLRGRVASLLEVGTGFHPELTGRENIFLNGAILGMSRAEIRAKFDEIVDFSGIEQFIDTPVKRYSSGMYVRLAFAVAAHLDPEILLVDEVLAVGDITFQRKCLGKMNDVTTQGRTVLFVSHNMPAVEKLCPRVCVIHRGELVYDGETSRGLKLYYDRLLEEVAKVSLAERQDRQGSGAVKVIAFSIRDDEGRPAGVLQTGRAYQFCFQFVSNTDRVSDIDFGFTVFDSAHAAILRNRTVESGIAIPDPFPRTGEFVCQIPRLPLTAGRYAFGFRLVVDGTESDYIVGAYAAYFDVAEGDYFGTGKMSSHARVLIDHAWRVSPVNDDSAKAVTVDAR